MNPRFTTILDAKSPRSTPACEVVDAARARRLGASDQSTATVPDGARSLLDPTLLAGLCLEEIESRGNSTVIRLSVDRAIASDTAIESWGGPVRLRFREVRVIDCSRCTPDSIRDGDPIIWNELHGPCVAGDPFVLLLRFQSNQRLRIEACCVAFASISLPC